MLSFSNFSQTLVILLCSVFLFGSCGAKKKSTQLASDKNTNIGSVTSKANKKQYYAELLGVKSKDLNMDLYDYLDEWMDVPHRMGGMAKSGVDCSGFVSLVYTEVYNKNLPRTSFEMSQNIKKKYDDQLEEGDLVFFSFSSNTIDHVGIYLHNDKFVHVSTKKGVIISNLKDTWYYKYFKRCGTPK